MHQSYQDGPETSQKLLETGNSTVTPVVSNLRIHPAPLFTLHPLLSSCDSSYLLDDSVNLSICLSTLVSSYIKRNESVTRLGCQKRDRNDAETNA